jgi:large subunit ribosomal protein L21
MYAVIKTGGKQYRVAANDTIQIEKLDGAPGDRVAFSEVLMVAGDGALDVGTPFLEGASVVGEIASHDRGPRLVVFKKRRRKHYRRKNGHRQELTSVVIREIVTGGAAAATGKE